ncbi:hypothetical protein PVAP13_1KG119608 [Panicum virgatum]|uniref:Uncharacterized protein n=1 Tax=Panicum virgatum TaxID=38727 RepID=A0A8T0X5S8_PANVG|nr:hypothetical protein PVAP13_1KG119608 [Panicum virgatum]
MQIWCVMGAPPLANAGAARRGSLAGDGEGLPLPALHPTLRPHAAAANTDDAAAAAGRPSSCLRRRHTVTLRSASVRTAIHRRSARTARGHVPPPPPPELTPPPPPPTLPPPTGTHPPPPPQHHPFPPWCIGGRCPPRRRRSAHLKAAAPAKARLNLASTVNIFMTNHPVEIPRISSTI